LLKSLIVFVCHGRCSTKAQDRQAQSRASQSNRPEETLPALEQSHAPLQHPLRPPVFAHALLALPGHSELLGTLHPSRQLTRSVSERPHERRQGEWSHAILHERALFVRFHLITFFILFVGQFI
jgi:hypothetical protein